VSKHLRHAVWWVIVILSVPLSLVLSAALVAYDKMDGFFDWLRRWAYREEYAPRDRVPVDDWDSDPRA
jgi:hypothetical protein